MNWLDKLGEFIYGLEDKQKPMKDNNGVVAFDEEEVQERTKAYYEKMKEIQAEEKEEMIAILKEPSFSSEKIIDWEGESLKQFEFRPETWEQFIGQEEAKARAKTIIRKAEKKMKAHFLVNGIKGHGKTTFVELVAKSLNAKLISVVGKQLNEDSLLDIINQINLSTEEYVMFFVDEIDSMDWRVIKILNPIIESFRINGKNIKPFIFAGATINKHILIENNPDTLDRIPTHIHFNKYNEDELVKILNQYVKQLYPEDRVQTETLYKIAENCKYNPRTSLALMEEYIVEKDIIKVLSNAKIIKNGLNKMDIDLLVALNESSRPIGANALAMQVGLSQREYEKEYEPFLVEYGYVKRVPSRVITDKGKEILGELL